MHESMKRLYEAARHPSSRRRCTSFAELGAVLDASPAVITNWKSRGVSKEGALAAERELGICAQWVRDGKGPQFVGLYSPTPPAGVVVHAAEPAGWPFTRVRVEHFRGLSKLQREGIEDAVISALKSANVDVTGELSRKQLA